MGFVDERTSGKTLNSESKKSEMGLDEDFEDGVIAAF